MVHFDDLLSRDIMLGRLFIFMFLGFLLEGWILVRMVMATSFWFTFFLCVFTSFLGVSFIRGAIVRLQVDAQQAMASSGSISRAVGGGLVQLFAGFLLLMPGILSDIVGILLMLPPFHALVKKRAGASRFVRDGQFGHMPFGAQFAEFQARQEARQPSSHTAADPSAQSMRDADAPPPDDDYIPPAASAPNTVIIDAEVIDDP